MFNFAKHNFINDTITEFQCYEQFPLSEADAVEIQNNLFAFINLLQEWSNTLKGKEDGYV